MELVNLHAKDSDDEPRLHLLPNWKIRSFFLVWRASWIAQLMRCNLAACPPWWTTSCLFLWHLFLFALVYHVSMDFYHSIFLCWHWHDAWICTDNILFPIICLGGLLHCYLLLLLSQLSQCSWRHFFVPFSVIMKWTEIHFSHDNFLCIKCWRIWPKLWHIFTELKKKNSPLNICSVLVN